jgi:hypothetical protein
MFGRSSPMAPTTIGNLVGPVPRRLELAVTFDPFKSY